MKRSTIICKNNRAPKEYQCTGAVLCHLSSTGIVSRIERPLNIFHQ